MDEQPTTYTPKEAIPTVKNLELSDAKITPNGGKIVFVSYESDNLYIKTDKLTMPFDASFYPDNEGSDNGKLQFTVNIDPATSKSNKDLCDFSEEIDKFIKAEAMKNHVQWLKLSKKNASPEAIENLYTSMKRVSVDPETGEPDGKYPPSFRFKIAKPKGKWECKVFDHNRKEINVNSMSNEEVFALFPKKSVIKVLLKLTVIWIAGGKFGVSWKAEQIKVVKPKTLEKYAFQDSDEDEDDDDEDEVEVNSDDDDEVEVTR